MGIIVNARKFEGGYINLPSLLANINVWSYSFSMKYISGQIIIQSGIEVNVKNNIVTVGAFQNNIRSGLTVTLPDTTNIYNYTLTCDGTNRKLYLNGNLVASDTNGGTIQNRTNGKIGINEDINVTGFSNGFLTELLLFNKCLSVNEVKALVGNINPDTNGIVGRYKFNEVNGVTTANKTVGTINGTYVGTWNAPQQISLPNPINTDANTTSLLHFDCTTDETGKVIIPYGGAQISNVQSKFGENSLFLNGSSQYLQLSDTSVGNITGNSTYEACFYWAGGNATIIDKGGNSNADSTMGIQIVNSKLYCAFRDSASSGLYLTGAIALTANQWYHVALVRYGVSLLVFLNGVLDVSGTLSSTTTINSTTKPLQIGLNGNTNYPRYLSGYVDEVRISNVARYTANFTPPTSAFTVDANTVFLSHFDKQLRTGLEDETGKIWTNSGVTINTSFKKFGSGSMAFKGNQYLTSPTLNLGNIWTLECFLYYSSAESFLSYVFRSSDEIFNVDINRPADGNKLEIYDTTNHACSVAPPRDRFFHIAVVCDGTNLKVYQEGILNLSMPAKIINGTITLGINEASSTYSYIDEVRISNIVRYNSNFTPPTQALNNNSLLLYYSYVI